MNARFRLLGVALVATLLAVPTPADGCGVAPPVGVTVEVATESAVVIWDKDSKTEHFIRRATFAASHPGSTPVKDFGLLVPTPAVPELAEVPDAAFDELAKLTAPRTETHSRPTGGGCALGCGGVKTAEAPAGRADVEVLAEKSVAGYDAKVLKANDADALTAWLTERGYEVRPALNQWLKPYLDKKWVVTAFKISNGPAATASQPIGSTAVRMSFAIEVPFFPYREPDDARAAKTPRLLRVFCIGDQKMAGSLEGGKAWPGRTVWAGKPDAGGRSAAAAQLNVPGFRFAEGMWLTEFEDRSSPRPGSADLEFRPAGDERPVERPPNVVYVARPDAGAKPAFALLGVAVAGLYLSRFLVGLANRRG